MEVGGRGWTEEFLGGSKEAEDELIRRRFAPEINRIQRDIEQINGATGIGRAQHGKLLVGTKKATFVVLPDIADDLQVGLFGPGKSYNAHVRFSKASSIEQGDSAPDLLGVAVRVLAESGGSHDFLMTNAPFSHARDALQFMVIASAVGRQGRPAGLWKRRQWRTAAGLLRIGRRLGLREAVRVLRTIREQTSRPVTSLATEQYWSRAPFAFGEVAVKYKLEGTARGDGQGAADLRGEMLSRLRDSDVVFDFKVQRYVDAEKTPIEDGTVEWKEEDAPFVTIARVTIPAQAIDEADEEEIDGHEFNPWNRSSDEYRPLGSMNRARRIVYAASARLRADGG